MKQKIIWTGVGILSVLVVVGIFWLGRQCGIKEMKNKGVAKTQEISSRTVSLKNLNQNSSYSNQHWGSAGSKTNTNTNAGKNKVQTPTIQKTFSNTFQNYEIKYPESWGLAQLGTSGREEDVDPTDGGCVSIGSKEGSIAILGKNHSPEMAEMCMQTWVGTDLTPAPDLQIEVFGKKYTASGMKTPSASSGNIKEFYYASIPSGEKIKLQIEINGKNAPETYYQETKEILLKTLKTLKHI